MSSTREKLLCDTCGISKTQKKESIYTHRKKSSVPGMKKARKPVAIENKKIQI